MVTGTCHIASKVKKLIKYKKWSLLDFKLRLWLPTSSTKALHTEGSMTLPNTATIWGLMAQDTSP